METKKCRGCSKEKDLSCFGKYRKNNGELTPKPKCFECNKPAQQKYYANNAQVIIAKNSLHKKQNRKLVNQRERNRIKNDAGYRLNQTIRSTVKTSIKRNKGCKGKLATLKYLDYSIEQLKEHIEKLFEPWMNWNNQGRYDPKTWKENDATTWKWRLDHIIPQSDLPYTSLEDENFKKCWALNNLRPLSAKQNIVDGPSRVRHKKKAE